MKSYRCVTKCFYGNRLWCMGDIMDSDEKVDSPYFEPMDSVDADNVLNSGEVRPSKRKAKASDVE